MWEDHRVKQVNELFSHLDLNKYQNIIFTGDFNSPKDWFGVKSSVTLKLHNNYFFFLFSCFFA